MRFLLFTLYAPLSAHGEVAVGERRMGWDRPGRSAILGLVSAALGVERTDEPAHRELDDGLWYAVRTDSVGKPFSDYHTTQVPGTRRNRRFATRRAELAADDLNTILSVREWRSDALYTVALWPKPESRVDLDAMGTALAHPRFTLYLGRKAGPLGWPLIPRTVEGDTLIEALKHDPAKGDTMCDRWLGSLGRSAPSLAFDADAPGTPAPSYTIVRRDQPVSRTRWQFAERREGVLEVLEEDAR